MNAMSARCCSAGSARTPVLRPAIRGIPLVARATTMPNQRDVKARVSDPCTTTLPDQGATSRSGAPTQNPEFGAEYFTAADCRPVILFDGVCNLCNGGVNFVLDWDVEGRFRYAALQSPAGRALLQRSGRSADDISSIVLVTPDSHFIKSSAVMRIAEELRMPLPVLAAVSHLFSDGIRDTVYDWVSHNRYNLFGESPQCRLMQPEWRDRFLV